jgi:hypothetical protein
MTLEQFEALLNHRFDMKFDDGSRLELTLVVVEALPSHPRGNDRPKRKPFSLVFRGPFTPLLRQQIYALEQETLGEISIFLVPIGPDEAGQRYEAVFN